MNKGKKFFITSLIVLLSFLIVSFLVLGLVPICTTSQSKFNDHSTFLRDCNSKNDKFGVVPLTEISLLGSHDACSNDINFGSKPNVNEDNIVNNGAARFFAKGAMVRYAKAQNEDVYDQLKSGARYLDIRITKIDGVYYNSHGLVSNTLEINLKKILKFLSENPGEFILFHVQNYYPSDLNLNELKTFISTVKLNDLSLFDYMNYSSSITEFSDLNYNVLTANGTKAGVVIFTHRDTKVMPFGQFNSEHFRSKCHGKIDANAMIEGIRKETLNCKNLKTTLRICQAQQTPNTAEWWNTLINWSLLRMAKNENYRILHLDDIKNILDSMPIYMCDWCSYNGNGFNDEIISLLKERNLSLTYS